MDLSFIPECYIDTNLIETLVPPIGKSYNHQKGCGTVTKVMKERFSDRFAVGIIDKDKKEVEYLKEFTLVASSDSLFLYKHKSRHHYLIQISPVIERMILENAELAGVNVGDYGFPSDIEEFKKLTKTETSKKDIRFKRLFKAILDAEGPDFEKLGKWIRYLRDKNYNVNINDLAQL